MTKKTAIDMLTVAAIASTAICLNLALHEGVHALTCIATGNRVQEFSALYITGKTATTLQGKFVSGSAPTFNIVAGLLLLILLRKSKKLAPESRFFVWLFMLINWLYGAGYLMFSGIANVGDMAGVISGWKPDWLWHVLMFTIGSAGFMFFVWLALKEFGKMVGGNADEQYKRANKLSILSYITSLAVVLATCFFCPTGLLTLPVTSGILAVSCALSPLLWMMQWFKARYFLKIVKEPLEIRRKWQWIITGAIVTFAFVFILGRTLYF
jgi:hypothetical protein